VNNKRNRMEESRKTQKEERREMNENKKKRTKKGQKREIEIKKESTMMVLFSVLASC
jgi:hypothetical protein